MQCLGLGLKLCAVCCLLLSVGLSHCRLRAGVEHTMGLASTESLHSHFRLLIMSITCVNVAQDLSKEDRKKLAIKSRCSIPQFGTQDRQRVINETHQRMLDIEVREKFNRDKHPTSKGFAVQQV